MANFDIVGVANVAMKSAVERDYAESVAKSLQIRNPVKQSELRMALAYAFARGVQASEEVLNAAADPDV